MRYVRMSLGRSILFTTAAVLACSDAGLSPNVPDDAVPVEIQPLTQAQAFRFNSGLGDRERLVIRDAVTWTRVWRQIAATAVPVPPVPSINFATSTVIVASMGTRASGGFSISVGDVRLAGGDAWISVQQKSPGARCGTTAAITAPVAVVLVQRFGGEAAFLERSLVVDC